MAIGVQPLPQRWEGSGQFVCGHRVRMVPSQR